MPKKTSRAARIQQNQQRPYRDTERKKFEAVRPLVITASSLADNRENLGSGPVISEGEEVPVTSLPLTSPQVIFSEGPTGNFVSPRPAPAPLTRTRPNPNFRRAAPARLPVLSREDEYSFVRSDLKTVFILTLIMLAALVVLTLIIGR